MATVTFALPVKKTRNPLGFQAIRSGVHPVHSWRSGEATAGAAVSERRGVSAPPKHYMPGWSMSTCGR